MPRSASQIEEELLVLRCQGGDQDAWAALVRTWRADAMAQASRLVRGTDVPDTVQETLLAMVLSIGSLRDPANFRAWSYAILKRKATDCIRRARREHRTRSSTRDVESATPDRDAGREVREAVSRLPDHLRETVLLFYVDGLTVAAIGIALGIPAGTAQSRLRSARNHLRRALTQYTDSHSKGQEQ